MIESIRNAFGIEEIRNKILFTIAMVVIYRLAANIPVPGVDIDQWLLFTESGVGTENLLGVLNLLSGGAIANFSVLSMGVYPYITASIIVQLLTPVIPYLEELSQEGESGRNRMNRITYYLTVPLALIQAIGQINLIGYQYSTTGEALATILPNFGFTTAANIVPTITTLLAMTAGTMFAIWLGELITENGVGQGISLIIFGGIASQIPINLINLFTETQNNIVDRVVSMIVLILIVVITTLVIVYIQEGERRIPVQYGRKVRGRKVYQGQSTHLPLKVNTAGMIPIIFAQSIMTLPSLVASFFLPDGLASPDEGLFTRGVRAVATGFNQGANLDVTRWAPAIFWIILFFVTVAFTFFYTDVMIRQQRMAQSLQQRGGFIPGIRPGKRTDEYIMAVVRRVTLVGAVFLGLVTVLPGFFQYLGWAIDIDGLYTSTLVIGGSGLIIIVGVIIDTMRQIEAQLIMRNYEKTMV